jgi:hypothetical protein
MPSDWRTQMTESCDSLYLTRINHDHGNARLGLSQWRSGTAAPGQRIVGLACTKVQLLPSRSLAT